MDEARLEKIAAWVAAHEGLRIGPEGAAALPPSRIWTPPAPSRPGERVVVFQTGDPANYV